MANQCISVNKTNHARDLSVDLSVGWHCPPSNSAGQAGKGKGNLNENDTAWIIFTYFIVLSWAGLKQSISYWTILTRVSLDVVRRLFSDPRIPFVG